ncbi:hypothetical protein ON010_g6730 [Phytophthora cinnamomi]|nr:hypothetical protein ON010_g6730 [Phytophthora cinnamomi]
MGISTAPDHFQARIDALLGDLDCVRCYLDDVMIVTTTTFEDDLRDLKLRRFAAKEADFLDRTLTPEGITPQPAKIAAIQRIATPRNCKELRHFLGMVNYYRDVGPRRAHLVASLSALTSTKVSWVWLPEHQSAFDKIKAITERETLLHYPDYSKGFDVHADASGVQLGGVISQEGKPLAFYSRKLTTAQKHYSVMEQELLSIVEIQKEFRTMLVGQRITVYTDHKNLSCANFASSRVMRWRLLLEEFGSIIHYERLAEAQQEDADLHETVQKYPRKFMKKELGDWTIITTEKQQLVIPSALQDTVLSFYHRVLLHPGMTRMYLTIAASVYWPEMKRSVEQLVKSCNTW